MSFEHLDDPQPPSLDDARWEQMNTAARARRSRRRRAQTGAVMSVLLVIGLVTAVAARSPEKHLRVHVAATSTSSGPTTSSTAALPASVWVTVELHVDNTTVRQGDNVTGTVVFNNRRSTTVGLPPSGCIGKWATAVAPVGTKPDVAFTADCRAQPRPDRAPTGGIDVGSVLAPGRTTVPFKASTRVNSCSPHGGQGGAPRCLPDGSMPPFAAGPARLWFVTDGVIPHLQVPAAIEIAIVPAPVDGAITVPNVLGMTPYEAMSVLWRAGGSAEPRTGFSQVCWHDQVSTAPTGIVVAQTPRAGATVSRAEKIELTVAALHPSQLEHCVVT